MERIAILKSEGSKMIIAHVSGNQIDILHCPFCGSGAVIGRSDGTVECGFCTSVYTVQVQPSYNGFPQSVDGQPYQWPGMPEGPGVMPPDQPPGTDMGQNPMDPNADPMDPNAPTDGGIGNLSPGAPAGGGSSDPADADDDDSSNPFAKGDKKSDSKSDKKKGDNPFAKKKSFLTATGSELDLDNYLAHLAITHAKNGEKVASMVKAARRAF